MITARIPLVLALLFTMPPWQDPGLAAREACLFSPGFQALHDQIPEIVGDCLAQEALNPATGIVEQQTAGGMLLWRADDSLTGFTDGLRLWPVGPDGVVSRQLDEPPFAWEGEPLAVGQPVPQPVPAPAAESAPAAPPAAAPPPCTQPALLPPDISITPPPPGLPPSVAAFSGIWEGVMIGESGVNNRWPVRFAVERIDATEAAIVFAAATRMNYPADWLRRPARVEAASKLVWTPSDNPGEGNYAFTMAANLQHIEALRQMFRYVIGRGTLTRCVQ